MSILFPENEYSIILADPPWSYKRGKGARGSSDKHYPTMSLSDICNLPVCDIAKEDSVLFLWATWPCLPEAMKVIESWGFEYKTVAFVWAKTNMKSEGFFTGLGYYTRSNTEFCLLATKGKGLVRQDKSVQQLVISPRRKHSQKPPEVRERIVQLYGVVDRIELFARDRVDGFAVWGLDVEL